MESMEVAFVPQQTDRTMAEVINMHIWQASLKFCGKDKNRTEQVTRTLATAYTDTAITPKQDCHWNPLYGAPVYHLSMLLNVRTEVIIELGHLLTPTWDNVTCMADGTKRSAQQQSCAAHSNLSSDAAVLLTATCLHMLLCCSQQPVFTCCCAAHSNLSSHAAVLLTATCLHMLLCRSAKHTINHAHYSCLALVAIVVEEDIGLWQILLQLFTASSLQVLLYQRDKHTINHAHYLCLHSCCSHSCWGRYWLVADSAAAVHSKQSSNVAVSQCEPHHQRCTLFMPR